MDQPTYQTSQAPPSIRDVPQNSLPVPIQDSSSIHPPEARREQSGHRRDHVGTTATFNGHRIYVKGLWVCPFAITSGNPDHYCYQYKLVTLSRLKQHLNVIHLEHNHKVKLRTGRRRNDPMKEERFIPQEKWPALSKKMSKTDDQTWYKMFDIIFPDYKGIPQPVAPVAQAGIAVPGPRQNEGIYPLGNYEAQNAQGVPAGMQTCITSPFEKSIEQEVLAPSSFNQQGQPGHLFLAQPTAQISQSATQSSRLGLGNAGLFDSIMNQDKKSASWTMVGPTVDEPNPPLAPNNSARYPLSPCSLPMSDTQSYREYCFSQETTPMPPTGSSVNYQPPMDLGTTDPMANQMFLPELNGTNCQQETPNQFVWKHIDPSFILNAPQSQDQNQQTAWQAQQQPESMYPDEGDEGCPSQPYSSSIDIYDDDSKNEIH
ncbi:hypothetical protein NOR_08309 [Metarhizium rileyi]|uniref:Uncharacterized protein n=1 Tax=Metarhizium rileyi (strain RCEF 4871) TaxID=1649241 RepID=A0A166WJG0_METRR|nr:hypothetical protein NOR_08309 [Metarhizium rileyi RCEF 4871]